MKTHSRKLQRGRLWRLAVCLLIAVVFVGTTVTAAYAASSGSVTLYMKDTESANGQGSGNGKDTWSTKYYTSTSKTVNLGVDGVYKAASSNFRGVYKAVLEANISQKSSIRPELSGNLKNVAAQYVGNTWRVVQTAGRNGNTILYSDFNTLMNAITLKYDSSSNYTEQEEVKISVRFYRQEYESGDGWFGLGGSWKEYDITSDATYFIVTMKFRDYASGAVAVSDDNPVTISYENESGSGNVVEGSVDVNKGVAQVPWQFSAFGDAKKVSVGYQLRSGTGTFIGAAVQGEQEFDLSKTSAKEKAEMLTEIRNMEVKGFGADAQYYARLVFITDGDTAAATYSDEVALRYDRPVISGFNMTNINKVYKGGETTNVTMTGTFNNSNYNNIEYCYDANETLVADCSKTGEVHDTTHHVVKGPRLQAKLYVTSNYLEVVQADGKILASTSTTWEKVGATITINMQNGDEISNTFDASRAKWDNVPVPAEDSRSNTFKAELIDMITGYTVTKYFTASTDSSGNRLAPTFVVDNTAPTTPNVVTNGVTNPNASQAVTVGGAGGTVTLNISGGTDIHNNVLGSGVAEYSYSMYYLPTDNSTAFAGASSTVQDIFTKLGTLSSSSQNSNVEYTDWTALQTTVTSDITTPSETATASLSVAQDGYYRVDVRTRDIAGYYSGVRTVYFRVDLTPPSTPDVYLAQGTSATSLKAYDNRTYKNEKVWLLVNSKPITGKTIEKWEFSNDGGLTWQVIKDVKTGASNIAAANLSQNTTGATAEVYMKGSYSAKENFQYAFAVNLSGHGLNDYQTIIARVTDSYGNISQVSDPVIMRTIAVQPVGEITVTHEGIEVALAMGNTNISSSTLTAEMKNAAAQKINEKFYGTTGSTSPTASNFNPWKYFQTLKHSAQTLNSDCYWVNDSSASGACHDGANCPYARVQAMGYSMYLPAQINVQGISGSNANNNSLFDWVRYDHTDYAFTTMPFTGVPVYSGTLTGPSDYYDSSTGKYIRANNRIKKDNLGTTSGSLGGTSISGDWTDEGKRTSIWTGDVIARVYHMMDVSYPMTPYSNGAKSWDATSSQGGDLTTIATAGYYTDNRRDWLFLYNDQPTKKTIYFTIDDGTAYPHANDGYGFFFNSTIRQSTSDSTWRLSGYLFYIGNPTTNSAGDLSDYKWFMIKVNDINMEKFADGSIRGSADDLAPYLMHNYSGNSNSTDYGLEVIAWATPLTVSSGDGKTDGSYNINNYVLVIEGTTTKFYNYKSNTYQTPNAGPTGPDAETLQKKFLSEVTTADPDGMSSHTSGYKLVTWTFTNTAYRGEDAGTLYTPRPTVDGFSIGAVGNSKHKDTDCYGFGPMVSSRQIGHSCYRDSRITFSNIVMQVDVARTLAEVVSEPQWGDGKAKYIMNLSDDSSADFNDPVMSAQVQWRLFNDSAKYIGWGAQSNQSITLDFLERIEGTGMYELTSDGTRAHQIDDLSTYITQQYYAALGYDIAAGAVVNQVTGNISATQMQSGVSFDLDDMKNFTLSVSQYDDSSANPDFPEGRWWIIHDTAGFPSATKSSRSDMWSDALKLTITEAGRYTVYFAPDRGADGYPINLDPKNAVFNFTVNETPVAQFSGTISSNVIKIDNGAYDPETLKPGTGFVTEYGTTKSGSSIQLSGITTGYWRWELLGQKSDTLVTLAKSNGWTTGTNPFNNVSLTNLTRGFVTSDGQSLASSSSGTYYFSTLPANSVLTVYQKVKDTTTYVTGYQMDADGNVYTKNADGTYSIKKTYYAQAATRGTTESLVSQQNLTEGGQTATYAPQAAFSLDTVNLYENADASAVVTITRESLQTQGKNTFTPSWAVDLNDGNGYRLLGKSGNNWYLYPEANYLTSNGKFKTEAQQEAGMGTLSATSDRLILTCTQSPSQSGGAGSGKWTVSKSVLSSKAKEGKLVLRLTESIPNVTNVAGQSGVTVKDQSARAIYFKDDTNPPTAQTVSAKTYTLNSSNGYTETNYAAGSYLDVSQVKGSDSVLRDNAYIELSVGGSVEREGKLAGYKYYFYRKVGSSTYYYKLDTNTGKLGNATTETGATNTLGASGGKIKITRLAMKSTPHDSLNVAVYAYDNAAVPNNTTPTKYENIKLTVSEPAAPAITAKDALGEVVNSIANDYVFYQSGKDATTGVPNYNASGTLGPDKMSVAENYAYSNSNITLQFTPKTAKYTLNSSGDYVAGGTSDMFTDAFNKADLTNTAVIIYSVLVRTTDTSAPGYGTVPGYEQYAYYTTRETVTNANGSSSVQDVPWKDMEISSTRTLTLTENGTYVVFAKVRNGAGRISKEQAIEFTIDKTAPEEIKSVELRNITDEGVDVGEYKSTQWSTGVKVTATGATDNNAASAYYEYSIDNGATWQTIVVGIDNPAEIPFKDTGEYTVMIRATDRAGNSGPITTTVVKIDRNPPDMTAPTLSVRSEEVTLYKEYIVTVEHSAAGGDVYTEYVDDGGNVQYTNIGSEFVCSSEDIMTFKIVRDADSQLDSVIFDGMNMMDTEYLTYDSAQDCWFLTTPPITRDATLKVNFLSNNPANQAIYALGETYAQTETAISNTLSTLAETVAADEGTTDETAADEGATDAQTAADEGATDEGTTDAETAADEGAADDTGSGEGEGEGEGGDGGVTAGPHTVVIIPPAGGVITGSVGEDAVTSGMLYNSSAVPDGAVVSLDITPESGWELDQLLINGNAADMSDFQYDLAEDTYSYKDFTATENLTIQASFKQLESRRANVSPSVGGTVTLGGKALAIGGKVDGYYKVYKGKQLNIVVAPNNNYQIETLEIDGETVISDPIVSQHTYAYTIPEGEETDVIEIKATFGIVEGAPAAQFKLGIEGDSTLGDIDGVTLEQTPGYTGAWATVEVPENSNYTVRFTAAEHYQFLDAILTTEDTLEEGSFNTRSVKDDVKTITEADGSVYYEYELKGILGNNTELALSFTINTYSVDITSNAGGSANLIGYSAIDRRSIAWGTGVTLNVTPNADYRVKKVTVNGADIGAVKSHQFSVTENTVIEVEFENREIDVRAMVHYIDVVANNISDKEDALADVPYRFRIKKSTDEDYGPWSEWQVGNSISFDGLEADSQYTVQVEARDVVGNSKTSETTIYTLANSPDPISAEPANEEENNSINKSAIITVDPKDNQADTSYRVYYSTSANMTDMQIANYSASAPEAEATDGWDQLTYNADTGTYEFLVKGLAPGQRYYMQLVAKNHEGVETPLTTKTVDVLLSHAAPNPNTFYFSEQAGPNGGITLNWVNILDDVTAVELYRDGVLLDRVDRELTSYVDTKSIPGNDICTYSYAYVNDAGAGSRRTAVSEEFFKAVNYATSDDSVALQAKYTAMDTMITDDDSTDQDLFSQTLTYPAYPLSITGTATVNGTSSTDGTITVYVNYNSSLIARPQGYELGLRAYNPGTDDLAPGWDDPETLKKYLVKTTAKDYRGAIAYWEDLDVNYEYYVYINEIYTTGPRYLQRWDENGDTTVDNYFGEETGVEGFLGKQYVVNGDGYYSQYIFETDPAGVIDPYGTYKKYGIKLDTVKSAEGEWTDEEILKYTGGIEWGANFSSRLKFNRSPDITLADTNVYAGSTNEVVDSEAGNYILVDDTNDGSFKLNVAAWDPDGTARDQTATASITVTIGNITNATITGIANADLPKDETAAQAKPFTIDLTVPPSTATTYYRDVVLMVDDGEIRTYSNSVKEGEEAAEEEKIDLVINRSKPMINTAVAGEDSGTNEYKIESGKTYAKSLLTVDTRLSGTADTLRPVRLRVMSGTYNELFGSHVLENIQAKLAEGNAKAVASAKALLGDAAYAAYGTDYAKLAKDAVDAVDPEFEAYIQVTDSNIISNASAYDLLVETTRDGSLRYWAEVNDALDNPDIPVWFTRDGSGYKVTAPAGEKHPIRIESSFGNNTNSVMLYFEVFNPTSAVIKSNQAWMWVEADQPEYDNYKANNYTIANVFANTSAAYSAKQDPNLVCPSLPAGQSTNIAAYKMENNKPYVYKLYDSELEVFNRDISGWVNITTGVYETFTEAHVFFVEKDANLEPQWSDLTDPRSGIRSVRVRDADGNTSKGLTGQGAEYYFSISELTPNQTYYLYTAYAYDDPVTEESVKVVNLEDSVILTTTVSYYLSTYGFGSRAASYEESKQSTATGDSGSLYSVSVDRSGDIGQTQTELTFTAEFYEADQFGNIIIENGVEKKLVDTEEVKYLSRAKEVFSFDQYTHGVTTTTQTYTTTDNGKRLTYYLRQNGVEQKHMVIRVTMQVTNQIENYSRVKDSAGVFEIFVLDLQSHVTQYKVGIDNTPDEENKSLKQVSETDYEYKFEGLQVGYNSNETRKITLINASDSEGALTNIKISVHTERSADSPTTNMFQVFTPAEYLSLVSRDTDPHDKIEIQVTPDYGLEDDIHEAWLHITADNVKTTDEIWIKLTQVVGQSTLSGRVFFTQTLPDDSVKTGVSTVSLYAYTGASSDNNGNISGELLYQTQTSEMGGYFKIENIINNQRYYLVVERDGYISYDTIYAGRVLDKDTSFKTEETSQNYELNLQLRGGDIDNDHDIDADDYVILNECFNTYYTSDTYAGTYAQSEDMKAFLAKCKSSDFNCDGIVNVFDRMIYWDSYSLRIENPNNQNETDRLLLSGAYEFFDDTDRPVKVEAETTTG